MCEPCQIPSREHGHKAEHKEDLREEQADSQADKAGDIQETMEASEATEASSSLSMTVCCEHQSDRTE